MSLMSRRRKPVVKKRQGGQHRLPHPWEASEKGSPFHNANIPTDRERLGFAPLRQPCKTLADMTRVERAAIEREYGAKIISTP